MANKTKLYNYLRNKKGREEQKKQENMETIIFQKYPLILKVDLHFANLQIFSKLILDTN